MSGTNDQQVIVTNTKKELTSSRVEKVKGSFRSAQEGHFGSDKCYPARKILAWVARDVIIF